MGTPAVSKAFLECLHHLSITTILKGENVMTTVYSMSTGFTPLFTRNFSTLVCTYFYLFKFYIKKNQYKQFTKNRYKYLHSLVTLTMRVYCLNCHLHLDGGVWIIVAYLKILSSEIINAFHIAKDLQFRERTWLPLKLQCREKRKCKNKLIHG